MKPEPAWLRRAKRPQWERDDPPRWSDVAPEVAGHVPVNRLRITVARGVARLAAVVDRIEALERRR